MFGSWVSKVLCLIPDSFSSLGLSHKRTWLMHEKLFHSCSYPFGHWSALNTPCYLCGWASSLSATDLPLLSEEELVHCCHHVSVQINKMFGVVGCCWFSLYCILCCWYRWSGECTKSRDWYLESVDMLWAWTGCDLTTAQPWPRDRQSIQLFDHQIKWF